MKRTIGLALLGLVTTLFLRCDPSENNSVDNHPVARSLKARVMSPTVSATDLAQQVAGNNAFSVDLYHQIRQDGSNLFFSPHSISTALAMLYGGARNTTAQQMAQALHFALPQDQLHPTFNKLDLELSSRGKGKKAADGGDFQLAVANALWGRPDGTYLPTFLDLMAINYGAGMNLVDFGHDAEGARQTINDWVASQTRDRIKDLLKSGDVDANTALVLTNAIYFNAAWQSPFNQKYTAPMSFSADGSSVTVQMMYDNRKASYAAGKGSQAVDLPFDGEELSMMVIVPDQGTFRAFQKGLTLSVIESVKAMLGTRTVSLRLPRFEYSSRNELKAALMQLGMTDAFDPMVSDFSGIVHAAPGSNAALMVKDVIHQAFVQVKEEGAEAAASTAVIMADAGISMPTDPPVELTVDRPFLFVIHDQATGAILFMGHVVDPNS
jgi:serpin B